MFQLILLTGIDDTTHFYAQSTAQKLDQNATVLIDNKKGEREKEGVWEGEGRERKTHNTVTLNLRCQFRFNPAFGLYGLSDRVNRTINFQKS